MEFHENVFGSCLSLISAECKNLAIVVRHPLSFCLFFYSACDVIGVMV